MKIHPQIINAMIAAVSSIAVALIGVLQINKSIEEKVARLDPVPIGTIIASFLTETQLNDLSEGHWVLADGRGVQNSDYARVTNNQKAPDLQGLFLRGYDPSSTHDPEGKSRIVGVSQPQQFAVQNHAHFERSLTLAGKWFQHAGTEQGVAGHADGPTGDPYKKFVSGPPIALDGSSTVAVSSETRPVNAVVYFYIKINAKKPYR